METVEEVITPEAQEVLTPEIVKFVRTETSQISTALQALEVKTAEDDKRAVELGLANKSAIKRLDAFREALVKPLNDHVKNINTIFKRISEPFLANDALIKSKRDIYIREQERIAAEKQRIADEEYRKEQERLNKKAEKKGIEPVVLPPPPKFEAPKTVHVGNGFSTVKKILKFEVIDPSLVPREYLMPDEKKIGAAVRGKLVNAIPGVRIWQENSQTF